jgi:hypothetical protein
MKEMSQRVAERKMRGFPREKGASVSVDKFDKVKGDDRILSIRLMATKL